MPSAHDEAGNVSLQPTIDKGQTRRMVAAMVDGSGLKIRALKHDLVITNPDDPERGRIYVEYANGYVTWERMVYEYWGPLQGYTDEDNPTRAGIGSNRILEALGRRTFKAGDS